MPDIPIITTGEDIDIRVDTIKDIEIPTYRLNTTSTSIPLSPPVVINIGVPVVDIPGCVEAHESNNKSKTIGEDDQEGIVTYCDGGIPSFNPIEYNPENTVITTPAAIPKTKIPEPEIPQSPKIENSETSSKTSEVECPTKVQQAQEPVGSFVEGFRKKVVGYELIDNTCVQITEKVPLPTQIVAGLPSGGQVMQVGGVAVIATTSALLAKPLADLLLKAVKPAVKKVLKKVASIRGKKPPVLSAGERRAEQRQMNHAVRELRSVFPRKKS
tara:strand:- start:47 stop:859 length:813 start_codon:yes stop_codon:yes gene_type:complete